MLQFLLSKEASSNCSNELTGSFDCSESKDGKRPFECLSIMAIQWQLASMKSFKGC
jgi:hypothetical protein